MTSVSDGFLLLERDERAQGTRGVLTRESGVMAPAGAILLGIDAEGRRHLYVPVDDEVIPEDRRSRGLVLVEDELLLGSDTRRFADLGCTDPALHGVFDRLVEDALDRISRDSGPPVAVVQTALGEWRELLRSAREGLSWEVIVGLTGELEVLSMIGVADPVGCWRGPEGALHDFSDGNTVLEVKTTASLDDDVVTITGLDQLDPPLGMALFFVVVSIREHGDGTTLSERVDSLLRSGLPRDRLYDLLAAAGYVHGHGGNERRFSVQRVRVWRVGDDFPGLRRSEFDPDRLNGVSKVRYNLTLPEAAPPLSDAEANSLFDTMRDPA